MEHWARITPSLRIFQLLQHWTTATTRKIRRTTDTLVSGNKGRILMGPTNLIEDEFEEDDMLKKWVGISYITSDEEGLPILNEAIRKELELGIDELQEEFGNEFYIENLLGKPLEDKKEWFVNVRNAREELECANIIIDEFSYPGALRDWAGLR